MPKTRRNCIFSDILSTMKIHLISDLHLESAPYVIPPDLHFDVLVVAGDVSETPERSMEFLTSVGKPVVFVLGNHDYWSGGEVDMAERLAQLRALAAGTNVHLLENESVILGGVRFLGCTLWSGYGADAYGDSRRGSGASKDLMRIGYCSMNDFHEIADDAWHEANPGKHVAWMEQELGWKHHGKRERCASPLGLYERHRASVEWLRQELRKGGHGAWSHTVVVTHHAPSWSVLESVGKVRDLAVADDPRRWAAIDRVDRDESGAVYLASYATPLDGLLYRHQEAIDVWCHGHIHAAHDSSIYGVRVISNPRGRSLLRYQQDWLRVAASRGLEAVPEGWRDHLTEANVGEGDHDNNLVVDPHDGAWPLVRKWVADAVPKLRSLLREMLELGTRAAQVEDEWCRTALQEAVASRLTAFDDLANEVNQKVAKAVVPRSFIGFNRRGYHHQEHIRHHIDWNIDWASIPEDFAFAYQWHTPEAVLKSCIRSLVRIARIPKLRAIAEQDALRAAAAGIARLAEMGIPATAQPYDGRFLGETIYLETPLSDEDERHDDTFTVLREVANKFRFDLRLDWLGGQ